jgi:hypothetical protein
MTATWWEDDIDEDDVERTGPGTPGIRYSPCGRITRANHQKSLIPSLEEFPKSVKLFYGKIVSAKQ